MSMITPLQRVQKAVIRLMNDERFVALTGIFMTGKRTVSDNPGMTACTNGRDEVYGIDFIKGLNDAQLRFLVAHETFHKMLLHATAYQSMHKMPGFNQQLANQAMDYCINAELETLAGSKSQSKIIEMPPDGCLDMKYAGMDWLTIYKLLKQQQQQQPQGGKGQGQGGPAGFDKHEFDQGDDPADGDGEGSDSGLPRLTAADLQKLGVDIDKALRQGAQMAGEGAAGLSRLVQGCLEAQVDWRAELMRFITEHCRGTELSTWRRPSRRGMAQGIYQPTRYDESLHRFTMGVDTSGSIGDDDLRQFLSEVKVALRAASPQIADMIYWDSEVARAEVYEGPDVMDLVESTKPAGGGGTNVSAMHAYLKRERIQPTVIVIFTDGHVPDWDGLDWPAPVLWCITTKGITAPSGKTLHISI